MMEACKSWRAIGATTLMCTIAATATATTFDPLANEDTAMPIDAVNEYLALTALQDAEGDDAAVPAEDSGPKWTGRVTAGASASFGNTDKQDAFATTVIERSFEDQLTTIDAGYYYSASDGDRTDNEFTVGARHEWLMPDSPWSYFIQGRYEYDEFQDWEHRLSAFGGIGYQFVDETDWRLKGLFGLGGSREFNSSNEDFKFEALLGVEVEWDISEKSKLTGSATLYPNLTDGGEFRTFSKVTFETLLDEELNLSLVVGGEHEHQSEAVSPTDKNDFRFLLGLQLDF